MPVHGITHIGVHAIRHGIVRTSAPPSPFTIDSGSGKAVPSSAAEWTAFRAANSLAVANPSSLYLCQEASGNLLDSIGAITLAAGGAAATYNSPQAGWTRTGVLMPDGVVSRFAAGAGVGPDPSTTSQTWLWIVGVQATPAGSRSMCGVNMSIAATRQEAIHLITTGFLRNNVVAVNTDGAASISTSVRPIVLKYDRTNSAAVIYSDLEKLVGTYSAGVVDGNKGIGETSGSRFLYGCRWDGAAGEISDADMKALLVAMNFTIPWS